MTQCTTSESPAFNAEPQLTALEVLALACGYQLWIDLRTKPPTLGTHAPAVDYRMEYLQEQFAFHVDEIMAAVRRAMQVSKQSRNHELATMPYAEYLQTPEWQRRRTEALDRAEHRCQVCNADSGIHIHHRTYERRGIEQPSDLIALCADCHQLFHDHGRLVK